jgi:helix-turn-helix protein
MNTTAQPLALTFAQIADLPVTVDLLTAAHALGIGRTTAYTLARTGEFPCLVLRVGGSYRVPTVGVLRLLGLDGPFAARRDQDSGHAPSGLGSPRAVPARVTTSTNPTTG